MFASLFFFFFQAEDGIRDKLVTGVQTCALPIFCAARRSSTSPVWSCISLVIVRRVAPSIWRSLIRSEEHTSELQSLAYLVCRLLLEKKKKETHTNNSRRHTWTHSRAVVTTPVDC